MPMRLYRTLAALGALTVATIPAATMIAAPAAAQQRPHGDQDRAFMMAQRGRAIPLPVIMRRVIPMMGDADYLTSEMDGDTYRLKFMRGNRVIFVDVDSRTGRILGKSGE